MPHAAYFVYHPGKYLPPPKSKSQLAAEDAAERSVAGGTAAATNGYQAGSGATNGLQAAGTNGYHAGGDEEQGGHVKA